MYDLLRNMLRALGAQYERGVLMSLPLPFRVDTKTDPKVLHLLLVMASSILRIEEKLKMSNFDTKPLIDAVDELGGALGEGLAALGGDLQAIKGKLDVQHPIGPDFQATLDRLRSLTQTVKTGFATLHSAAGAISDQEDTEFEPDAPVIPPVVPPVVPPVEPPPVVVPPVEPHPVVVEPPVVPPVISPVEPTDPPPVITTEPV